jgi:hypothetical protein
MEAYYNTIRALEDMFYSIELNTFPAGTQGGRRTRQDHVGVNHCSPECLCAGRRKTVCQPRADTLEPRGTLGGSLESSGRGAYGRGPLELGVCVLLTRGV